MWLLLECTRHCILGKVVVGLLPQSARMLVPKSVCEASKVSEFAWFMGGDGDISLNKLMRQRLGHIALLEKEFRNTHAR